MSYFLLLLLLFYYSFCQNGSILYYSIRALMNQWGLEGNSATRRVGSTGTGWIDAKEITWIINHAEEKTLQQGVRIWNSLAKLIRNLRLWTEKNGPSIILYNILERFIPMCVFCFNLCWTWAHWLFSTYGLRNLIRSFADDYNMLPLTWGFCFTTTRKLYWPLDSTCANYFKWKLVPFQDVKCTTFIKY